MPKMTGTAEKKEALHNHSTPHILRFEHRNLNLNIGEVLSTLKMPRESRARGARL